MATHGGRWHDTRTRACPPTLADRLVESVPNVSEGRRLDVVERLADAIIVGRGVPAPRPDERREPQPVGLHAGGSGRRRVARRSSRLVAAAIREIDMDAHWGEHPRIGAVDVIPFVPLGDDDDGRGDRARPRRSAPESRREYDLPVYLYAQAARRGDRVKLADVRRGQYEGLKLEIGQNGREPDLGSRPDAPVGRGRRGRGAAVPDRLQHQPRQRRRRARQADRAARPRVRRRPADGSRPTGSSSRSWPAGRRSR